MKSTILVKAFLCLSLSLLSKRNSAQSLTVGDKVPEIIFERMLNNRSESGKLTNYAGKAIVLDFWATWCAPCVTALPKMQALQDKYQDQLQVICVSSEEEKIINGFLKSRKDIRLPIAIQNETLGKLFPFRVIPHSIVIDQQGVIQAITRSENVNEKVINDVLAGKKIALAIKRDIMGEVSLDDKEANPVENILFRSELTKNLKGTACSGGDVFVDSRSIGLRSINFSLAMLFIQSAGLAENYYNRIWITPGTDSSLFYQIGQDTASDVDAWANKNAYCYELIAPTYTQEERLAIMRRDLAAGLPWVKQNMETREMDCMVLVATDEKKLKKSSFTKYGSGSTNSAKHEAYYLGAAMDDLAYAIETITNVPVINESGLKQRYDLTLDISLINHKKRLNGLADFNKALNPMGLALKTEKRMIEVIALHVSPSGK